MSFVDVATDGKTTIFTLNRPDKLNAISAAFAVEIQQKFAEFDASDQAVAIIAGAGKAFSSGADIADLPELWRCVPTLGITTAKPVICAVHGWCIGAGFVIAAMADLCVASRNARFSYPEGRLGVTGGMIATLAGRIAHKHAMEVMLLGRPLEAQRAYEMGLVNEVVDDGRHVDAALAMARELEGMAPLVLKTLKRLVVDHTLVRSPSEAMALTQRDIRKVETSSDFEEGRAAFREKRQPRFTGS